MGRPGLGGHAADAGACAGSHSSACARGPPASPGGGALAACWSSRGRGRPARRAQTGTRLCPFEARAAKCGRPAPNPARAGLHAGCGRARDLKAIPTSRMCISSPGKCRWWGGSRVWAQQLTPPAPLWALGPSLTGPALLGPTISQDGKLPLGPAGRRQVCEQVAGVGVGRGGAVGGCHGGCRGGTTRPPPRRVRWGGRQRHRLQTPCRRLPASRPRPRANCEPTAPHRQLPSPGRSWPACPRSLWTEPCTIMYITCARMRS